MSTIRYFWGIVAAVIGLVAITEMCSTLELAQADVSECAAKHVALNDFVDMKGYPRDTAFARKLDLDTSVVLIRSNNASPKLPDQLPETWTKGGAISTSTLRIRNERNDKNKLTAEMETFLVLRWNEPLPMCYFLAGWETWMSEQLTARGNTLGEALLIFTQQGTRKILRDYILVTLTPGTHPDVFNQEVLRPLESENIKFSSKVEIPDPVLGVWKVMLRTSEMTFPLRATRTLAGVRQYVSAVEPVFIPFLSTISTTSSIERLEGNGKKIRFQEGETIYSEQASYDGLFELSVTVGILRSESGNPYFRMLTNIQEFSKGISESLNPKIEGALRIDANTCWEHRNDVDSGEYVYTTFICRFVPALAGKFELGTLPLRFEIYGGGTPFTISTEQSFVFNIVELRHPEQTGIVSHIGEFPISIEQKETAIPDALENETIFKKIRKSIVSARDSIAGYVLAGWNDFSADHRAALRKKESTIVMVLVVTFLFTFLVRVYFWGLGSIPPLFDTLKRTVQFLVSVVAYVAIPMKIHRQSGSTLRRIVSIVHKGEEIGHLSTESLALRCGIYLDAEPQSFVSWLDARNTVTGAYERTQLENIFAALWLEEHATLAGGIDDEMLQCFRARLLRPFSFRCVLRLPEYLQNMSIEYRRRTGVDACH